MQASLWKLLTPTLFDYEIANALRVAVTRQRLSEHETAMALTDFAEYAIIPYVSRASPATPSNCLVSIGVQHTIVPIWRWPKVGHMVLHWG